MRLRSLLFVPADRPERFAKAAASGADAIILDLEDSVTSEAKPAARAAAGQWLAAGPVPSQPPTLVRINPLGSAWAEADLAAILPHPPAGILLPKAEGAASVARLRQMLGEMQQGAPAPILPPILPIATETPAAVFALGSFVGVGADLLGLTWGAEDLPAAIGASAAREADGSYTPPYQLVRSLALFAAHAAGAPAIETVFPDIADEAGLATYVARARRDGFSGMLAIHPRQVPIINAGFAPSPEECAHARAVIDAFAAQPGAGAVRLDGRMIDRPHLVQARRMLGLTSC